MPLMTSILSYFGGSQEEKKQREEEVANDSDKENTISDNKCKPNIDEIDVKQMKNIIKDDYVPSNMNETKDIDDTTDKACCDEDTTEKTSSVKDATEKSIIQDDTKCTQEESLKLEVKESDQSEDQSMKNVTEMECANESNTSPESKKSEDQETKNVTEMETNINIECSNSPESEVKESEQQTMENVTETVANSDRECSNDSNIGTDSKESEDHNATEMETNTDRECANGSNTSPEPVSSASKSDVEVIPESTTSSSPATKGENKLTQEMIDAENEILTEEQKSLEEIRIRAKQELERTGKKQRYDRLKLLLDRSKLYATYLAGRLDARDEEEKAKKEAKLKKEQNKEEQQKKEEQSSQEIRRGTRKRKAKVFPDEESSSQEKTKSSDDKKKKEAKKRGQGKRKRNDASSDSQSDKEDKSKKVKVEETDEPKEKKTSKLVQEHSERTFNGEKIDERQPILLTSAVMREYQLNGLDWLKGLFEHGINGILADEMGLGKTIQSIALLCSLIEKGVIGPFLVAAPLSTLPNWISEFKKFAPELHVILYHGNPKERAQLRRKMFRLKKYSHGLASLPIIISSYEILMRDRPLLENYGMIWKYLIVDEGHRIKNLNCRLIKELKAYRVENRLLLTGTPLQNNLSELWSLLNFLLPDIFDDLNSFQRWFDFSILTDNNNGEGNVNEELIAQEEEGQVLQTLHSILTPFLLRRLKTDVDLSIPPKKEILVYAPLTEKQQTFYRTTLDRTILDMISEKNKPPTPPELTPTGRPKRKSANHVKYQVDDDDDDDADFDLDQLIKHFEEQEKAMKEQKAQAALDAKLSKKAIVNIKLQNILMLLRKVCNHPYLIEYPFNPKTDELIINEQLIECSGKMLILDRMLPALKELGHKVLLFSQMTTMLDILGDYCNLRKFKYSRIDGSMNIMDRQANVSYYCCKAQKNKCGVPQEKDTSQDVDAKNQIENFSSDPENFLFLLSTRAGGLGLNLMMADTCIIYDSDWNPQADLQAQDRCHRIGQKNPVIIYRLVTANTVDEKIIERAANKRKLEKMIIHKKNFKGRGLASAITPKELVELLESTDAHSSVNDGSVISDDGLKKLLDRSDMMHWNKTKTENQDINEKKNENLKNEKLKNENKEDKNELFKVLETGENDGNVVF